MQYLPFNFQYWVTLALFEHNKIYLLYAIKASKIYY